MIYATEENGLQGYGSITVTAGDPPAEAMIALMGHLERMLNDADVPVTFSAVEPSQHDPLTTVRFDILIDGKGEDA